MSFSKDIFAGALIFFTIFGLGRIANCQYSNKAVGDICTDNSTCSFSNHSFCDQNVNPNICKCLTNYIPSENNLECLEADVLIGGTCKEHKQCVAFSGGRSTCTESGKCDCLSEYTHSNNLKDCLPIIHTLNDEECQESPQCQFGNPGYLSECVPNAAGKNNTCNCNIEAVNAPTEHVCYRKAALVRDDCTIQSQCTASLGESRCINDICECNSNYTSSKNNTRCVQLLNIADPCVDEKQCTEMANANCHPRNASDPATGSICQCNQGYGNPLGVNKCYALSYSIGAPCDDDFQCDPVGSTNCVGNGTVKTCQCISNHTASHTGTRCLKEVTNLHGDPCLENGQCLVDNSECRNNGSSNPLNQTCECVENYFVQNGNGTQCLQILQEINLGCSESIQCTSGIGNLSECRDQKCQCKHHYEYIEGQCYIPTKLDQPCDINEQCYVGVNNLTLCVANVQDEQKRCRCLAGAIRFDDKCFQPNIIGNFCQTKTECEISIKGDVICDLDTKACTCNLGSSPALANTMCISGSAMLSYHFKFSLSITLVLILTKFYPV